MSEWSAFDGERRRVSPHRPAISDHSEQVTSGCLPQRSEPFGREAVLALQRSAGNRAVQRLFVVQRSPGPEERKALVDKVMRLIVARLTASELFVDAQDSEQDRGSEEAPTLRQPPPLATLASARISKSLAAILKEQEAEGRPTLEWQFLAVGLKPPAAESSSMDASTTKEEEPEETKESAMETDEQKPEPTAIGFGLPSFVEVEQTESGAPSLGYKQGTRPRIVYANNPASKIGYKTEKIKRFEDKERRRLLAESTSQGQPIKKLKGKSSSTARLSSQGQQTLRAAVDAKVHKDELRRLRAEFGDVPAEVLPKNIRSAELVPELRVRGGTGTDTFHAETRLVYEGCDHVTVSGPPSITTSEEEGEGKSEGESDVRFGKQYNCVFCSLYRMIHGLPFSFHTDKVKSWYLPEQLSIAEFFGDEVAAKELTADFVREFMPGGTSDAFGAQDLIDCLTNKNIPWPKLSRGQKELT